MFATVKKWWRYMGTKLNMSFDEHADPKVQIEQAYTEAQDQHRRLREQAATVIAHQKQAEMKLNAAFTDLEKLHRNAQQAVLMADDAARAGDDAKVAEYTHAAEAYANRLIATEAEVERLKALVLDSTSAADAAKAAVRQNEARLQQASAQRQELRGKLDQAQMAERMNAAQQAVAGELGGDVPTLDEVRAKIEQRYAKAQGVSEISGLGVDSKLLEVERAADEAQAQARLSEIRSRLGITSPGAATSPQPGTDTASGSST